MNILIFLVALLWGMGMIFEKYYLLTNIKPLELTLIRSILTILVIIALYFTSYKKDLQVKNLLNNPDISWFRVFWVSMLSIAGSILFWYLLKAENASKVIVAIPPIQYCVVFFFGMIFFGESFKPRQWLGVIFSFAALFFLNN